MKILFDSISFEKYGTIRSIKNSILPEKCKIATLQKADRFEVSAIATLLIRNQITQ